MENKNADTKVEKKSLKVQMKELNNQLLQAVLNNEKPEQLQALKNAIKAIKQKLSEQDNEKSSKKAQKELKKEQFEQTHVYFRIKDKIMILKGYVFDNAIVVNSYTANGYIVVVSDAQGKTFFSINTRIKEGKRLNSGQYLAKDQLLGKEKPVIIENLKQAFSDEFQVALSKVKQTSENQFKRVCTNKRVLSLVDKVVKFASNYNKKKV